MDLETKLKIDAYYIYKYCANYSSLEEYLKKEF